MRKLELLAVVLLFTISGCGTLLPKATHLEVIAFDQVSADPAQFNEKVVNIKGYIQADVLGSTSLYATVDDAAQNRMYDAIDILSKNVELRKAIKYKSPTCVIASGKFRTYKQSEFKFDMPSRIGVIDLESISPC